MDSPSLSHSFLNFRIVLSLVDHIATLTAILPPLADKLCNSLIGLSLFPTKCNMPEKLKTPLDQFYYNIEKEIFSMTKTLNLVNLMY